MIPRRTARRHLIDIQVEEQVGPVDIKPLQKAVTETLLQYDIQQRCEVVVVISDDAALRDLNQRFRGEDHATDVLSFADDTRGPFASGGGNLPTYLGDIVISIDRARAQAEAVGGTVVQELQLLAVHGTLHLLGYDHADQDQKAAMWAAQADILARLGIDMPLPE